MITDIIEMILDFGNCGIELEKAKQIRKDIIATKKHIKGQWGSINHGNCGDTRFFKYGKDMMFHFYREEQRYPDKECIFVRDDCYPTNSTHSGL